MVIQSTTQNTYKTDSASNNEKSKVDGKYSSQFQQEILDNNLDPQSIRENFIQELMDKGESKEDATERARLYATILGINTYPGELDFSPQFFNKGASDDLKNTFKESVKEEFDKLPVDKIMTVFGSMIPSTSEYEIYDYDNYQGPSGVITEFGPREKDGMSSFENTIEYLHNIILRLSTTEQDLGDKRADIIDSFSNILNTFKDKIDNMGNKETENKTLLNQYTRDNKQNALESENI